MKNKIILYDLSGKNNIRFSPPCWNVKLCLIHNNIDFDTIPIRFTEKDKISFSNQTLVPIIKYNEEIISDSWNIFVWLNDKIKKIEKGIYLSTRNDDQVYHWIFDNLSRLYCIDKISKLKTYPLIIKNQLSKFQKRTFRIYESY